MQISGDGNYYGIYNWTKSSWVQPCKYVFSAGGFTAGNNGFAIAKDEYDRYGVFNTDGAVVIPFRYSHLSWVKVDNKTNGMLVAQNSNGKYGLINTKGQTLAPFEFQHINGKVRNGTISAQANGKSGLIDFNGNIVSPFIYDYLVLEDEYRYPLASIGNYTPEKNNVFARVQYNGYKYAVDENWNVIGERQPISKGGSSSSSQGNYTSGNSSSGSWLVAGAIVAGIAALITSPSSSSSSSKSTTATSSNLYEGCSVKCFLWDKGSGYYGRVTAIKGDKCSVYIDRVVLKGLLTLYIGASQYTGWKDLAYTTHYDPDLRRQLYGMGTIIEVPIYCLELN